MVYCHYTTPTGLCWEVRSFGKACAFVLQTDEAESWVLLGVFYCVGGRTANSHAEALIVLVFDMESK
jgi:hypothetical protein